MVASHSIIVCSIEDSAWVAFGLRQVIDDSKWVFTCSEPNCYEFGIVCQEEDIPRLAKVLEMLDGLGMYYVTSLDVSTT